MLSKGLSRVFSNTTVQKHQFFGTQLSLKSCPTLATQWTIACQAPLSMEFSRQEYWSFSFRISPSNKHPGLISFRTDWLDLLAVQGTLKSLLQYYSSKASIFRHSAFFIVQLSHPYMTTGKTIALTRQTFVGKVMSLLFNMLSRLVIAFLPRSKCLVISWLQSCYFICTDFGAPKNKVCHCFHCFSIYLP